MRYVNLLDRIRETDPQLRPSERKVAALVLSDPSKVMSSSISTVAVEADVSEPTVLRFCRAIGCSGFQTFKLDLAQCLASGTPFVHETIEAGDSIATVGSKVCQHFISAVGSLRDSLDWEAVDRAVESLASAQRIEFHGVGASGVVALDAQHKFFRLGVPVIAHNDVHMQAMSASGMKAGEVLVSFSYTGRTLDIINAAEIARSKGALVVAVTTEGSPLSRIATHPIGLPMFENISVYTPMLSRILQTVVVDILEIGVALRRGPELIEKLRHIKESLIPLRPELDENVLLAMKKITVRD